MIFDRNVFIEFSKSRQHGCTSPPANEIVRKNHDQNRDVYLRGLGMVLDGVCVGWKVRVIRCDTNNAPTHKNTYLRWPNSLAYCSTKHRVSGHRTRVIVCVYVCMCVSRCLSLGSLFLWYISPTYD